MFIYRNNIGNVIIIWLIYTIFRSSIQPTRTVYYCAHRLNDRNDSRSLARWTSILADSCSVSRTFITSEINGRASRLRAIFKLSIDDENRSSSRPSLKDPIWNISSSLAPNVLCSVQWDCWFLLLQPWKSNKIKQNWNEYILTILSIRHKTKWKERICIYISVD